MNPPINDTETEIETTQNIAEGITDTLEETSHASVDVFD